MATWQTVCAFLAELPETQRTPPDHHVDGVRVRGKLIAYLPGNARSRPDDARGGEEFVVVRVAYEERAALLQQDPHTFIVTPHYQNYPGVIVRLATVDPAQVRELLVDAWRRVAPKRLVREFDRSERL